MYILKNAFTSIVRNKGRNILIGIIIMVIAASCAVTLAIRSSADKIVESYANKYPYQATIGMNREALTKSFKENTSSQEDMIKSFNDIESLTVEEIEKYGDSDYVPSYYYTYSINLNGKDIDEATDNLVKETTTTETETTPRTETFENPPSGERGARGSSGTKSTTENKKTTTTIENIRNEKAAKGSFTLIGYNSYESMSDFINGNYTITDGEVSSDFEANTCVISEELSTLNELKVGDKITLISPYNEDVTYELEITGIYKENTESSSDMKNMFTNSANNIITNITVVQNIVDKDEDIIPIVSPTYIIKDEDSIDKFKEEVIEEGLSEFYTVSDNRETIASATKSIVSVKSFATTFLIITLVIGAVVLFVINMINIRERKYEIGVLRTIGMKKGLVVCQFMTELLVVCIVSLLLGAFIGSVSSVKISNQLLSNEIENAQSDYEDINKNFGGGMKWDRRQSTQFGISQIEEVDSIDAVVDFKVLGQLLSIGIALTIVSSISSMIAISRFSPLDILKERS